MSDVIIGRRVILEPLTPEFAAEVDRLDRQRELLPRTGHVFKRGVPSRCFDVHRLIRVNNDEKRSIGVVANSEVAPGVAEVTLYIDETVAPKGAALEAYALYVTRIFEKGASKIQITVLEFDDVEINIMRKLNLKLQARLRQHSYGAGHFWDLLVFGLTEDYWREVVSTYRRALERNRLTGSSSPLPR